MCVCVCVGGGGGVSTVNQGHIQTLHHQTEDGTRFVDTCILLHLRVCWKKKNNMRRVWSLVQPLKSHTQVVRPQFFLQSVPPLLVVQWNLVNNEVLGTMKFTLLHQVSHYIRVQKQRNIKIWDQQNYLVIRGFCYIRPLYNEIPLYN